LRFAVHRPGIPVASPRSHRMPCGDISRCVDVRVEREVAGHAGEERLALAALRCDVPTRRATLTGERSFNSLYPARRLVLQAAYQQAPARPENLPIQSGFRPDIPAGSLFRAPCRAGHPLDVEVFDPDQVEASNQIGTYLLGPVLAGIRLAGFELRDGQLHPSAAVRAAFGPCQLALQEAKSVPLPGVDPGSMQHLARGQRCADRHAPVDSHRLAITGGGNGPGKGDGSRRNRYIRTH
jgi:hypothetical protein